MKYALLAVDPVQWRYYVPCAMSAVLWRWAGWTPFVMKFGPQEGWEHPLASRALEEMRKTAPVIKDVEVFDVPKWSNNPRFHAITGSRRLAAAMWFDPFSYIILGDADMLLLHDEYLQPDLTQSFHCWGVDMFHPDDGRPYPRWPSCYAGATAGTWKEIMRPASPDLAEATRQHMETTREFAFAHHGGTWNCEPGFHAMLEQWAGYPTYCQMIRRKDSGMDAYGGRLYPRHNLSPRDPIDCHIRGDWRLNMRWDYLMKHSARVPGPIKLQLAKFRLDCLKIMAENGEGIL